MDKLKMEKIKLNFTHDNAVAQIILDDGKGNVLDSMMMKELHSIFQKLQSYHLIKLITIEGAGKHFSFGASVFEHTKDQAPQMLRDFHQLFYDIIDLSIPVAAKVTGQCLGGGMELALITNFIFADATAKFGQPEIVLGVFAPPASILLPMKIGQVAAEELLLTGKVISAEEAKNFGLIYNISQDKESLNIFVEEWVETNIIPKSASSLRYAVRAGRKVFNETLLTKLPELEKLFIEKLMETEDANEGINAFLEKRKPIWKNI
jgi:cyclohexa-1,5-dienecarbonyl-CoA hydratase